MAVAFAVNAAREEASRRVSQERAVVRRGGASWSRGVFTFMCNSSVCLVGIQWTGEWWCCDGPAPDAVAGIGSGNEAWAIPPSRSESFHSVLTAAETGATKTQTRNSMS